MPNVVVRFEGEGGVKKIDPLKLTKRTSYSRTSGRSKLCKSIRRWKLANRVW